MFENISEIWENAPAFLVNGKACNDFSFTEDEEIEDFCYVSFYITTSSYEKLEYFIDIEDIETAILEDKNLLRLTKQNITIQPLFFKDK